mgnify:CR=1 FL=1
MTTNIIFKDRTGAIKGSINTHHGDDPLFIRDMTASHLATSGVFQDFGKAGDTITVERGLPLGVGIVPGEGKLEKLCSGQCADEESGSTVSTYHVIDDALMGELETMYDEGNMGGYSDLVLSTLGLESDFGEIAPGARYTTYSVERVSLDLVVVIETVALNV